MQYIKTGCGKQSIVSWVSVFWSGYRQFCYKIKNRQSQVVLFECKYFDDRWTILLLRTLAILTFSFD